MTKIIVSTADAEEETTPKRGAASVVWGQSHKKPRLAGGSNLCSGRVEVVHGKTWDTVCGGDFDLQDAEVVCRELGCGVPVEVLGAATFGKGEGQVWSEEIQCRGNESQIFFCPTSSSQKRNCSHDNDVGLICTAYTDFRLVNGFDSCSGRVELQYLSEWGTVCDVSWDIRASNVLCGQLSCGSAVAIVGGDWFREGSGQIWSDVFDCQGNETRLSACVISSWSRAACSHRQDAGVICSSSSMSVHYGRAQLTGERECEGEVEVYLHEVWRRVLLDSWSVTEASVVCRQLGCGSVVKFYGSSPSSPGASDECLTGFQCSGTEAHLGNCSFPQTTNCSSSQQLSITCTGEYCHRFLRLVGSGSDCAGRLEVFHEGTWGTVCDDSWDIKDAQVACRQLQCGEALSGPVPAWFGPGTGPIWLDEVDCMGNESSLWSCLSEGWGQHDCGHKEDVGVLCSDFKEIRLTEGCSGNLEVFYNGTWGNVCMNQMDSDTVSLICQELNCGKSGSVDFTGPRVSSAPNWIDFMKCRKHDIGLWNCPSSPWGQNECSDQRIAQITCSDHLPLRLEGGEDQCSGRLEVYHNGIWGSVCDDLWDIRDAQAVCRQLGCGPALRADGNAAFGRGEGAVWLSRVECRGNEIHLWDCSLSLKNHTDCSHEEDAGLTCTGYVTRLSDGSDLCSGRLELFRGEEWVTVCDADFEVLDAEVVCRELGCGVPVEVLGAAAFGKGEGQVWSEEIQCKGDESHIFFCPMSPSQSQNCSHDNDVGLICSAYTDFRLVNGSDSCCGRVELQYLSEWGTVCDVSWDIRATSVLCRQLSCGSAVAILGCGSVVRFYGSSPSSPGASDECLTGFQCSGTEAHLGNCSFPQTTPCSSSQQLSIICSGHRSLRLVGSGSDCAGRLEVFHEGSWGTVCDDSWDIKDAQVVCRQLQCGEALSGPVPAWFGPGTGPIWLDEVDCMGNETSLWSCLSEGWGRHDCGQKEDVGVLCSEFKEIRLTEGCSGNLEVFYNGTWGNVCMNQMDSDTVSFVCQELNCGKSGSVDWARSRVNSAPNWIDGVKCRKHDISLWNCPSSPWGQNECSDLEVAQIDCSVSTTRQTIHVQTQPLADLSIPTALFLVLGTLLLLLLVLLVVLLCQNRALRRALSKRRHITLHEVVYEEIDHRLITERTTDSVQRGRLLSEGQNSGYEDVEDDLFSAESLTEEKVEYYDDVKTTNDLTEEMVTQDSPENYDDVISTGQSPDSVIVEEIVAELPAESYDDVITVGENPEIVVDLISSEVSLEDCDDSITSGHVPSDLIVDGVDEYDGVEIVDEKQEKQLD
ncbi:LOW QUALITY PROTEIN: antigen WC1.1-like [Chanos chanos]|uniref:LOW QUALITY PROTEIN: antigen WC1.1-like n=1 Tax=Chanos chanos TaxID=29144 RepID=A0A6J2X014_CHACN|nr:LOW QUALITY PROTEIN: antigen WC1.1-like [Chanos chanos]